MKFHKIYIEITNICGLTCSFCPPKKNQPAVMELGFFKKILEEISPYTKRIALHLLGDPLCVGSLESYLDCALEYGLEVEITTTGYHLRKFPTDLLLHPVIRQINFSLNSYNGNAMKISLDGYLEPIFNVCDAKLKQDTHSFINLRLWNQDKEESAKLFNEMIFSKIECRFGVTLPRDSDSTQRSSVRIARHILIHFDSYFEWPSLMNTVTSDGYCHGLSSHIGILCDGRVVPCCLDGEGVMMLGDLHMQSLSEILNTKRVMLIREGFKKGKAYEELCQKCSYKERFDKRGL